MVEVLEDEQLGPPPLDWSKWDSISSVNLDCSYDKHRDVLFMHLLPKRPAVSLDVSGLLWIRYLPISGEVVGLEIEDFDQVFLKRFPELALAWQQVKSGITKRPKRNGSVMDGYVRILLSLIQNILGKNPPQMSLPAV
ncbi:MAG: hypothetical protein IIC33_09760 [Chloroflexi bacterium]|nr:hypothetical protein [Chloroflexota bacterium]